MKGKYLITTDEWFTAPDGNDYKAVWGEVEVFGDEILGIKTNSRSTNWFAKVGTEEKHVIIAGCQIHYAAKTDKIPDTSGGRSWEVINGEIKNLKTPNKIWFTE